MFMSGQSVMIKVGTRVFCDKIGHLYSTYENQTIQIPTTAKGTWKEARIKRILDNSEFGYQMICIGGAKLLLHPNHLLDHKRACEYGYRSFIPTNSVPFFDWIDSNHGYPYGFFLGLFACEEYKEDLEIHSGRIRKTLESHILSVFSQIDHFDYKVKREVLPDSYKDGWSQMTISFKDCELIKDFLKRFLCPDGSLWDCILYNQNFRRGVLDGLKCHTEYWDTNFESTVAKVTKGLAKVMRALDVSLGRICFLEDRESDLKCWLVDDDTSIQKYNGMFEVLNSYSEIHLEDYWYSFDLREPVDGSLILPSGILSDLVQGE